ncbi:AMP-dependent synthetase and ligase [Halorubrum aidingense JCM 13560]|uniref:2-succinylbenzoate--CoA ligase n=1 Tax=Halorubrum aidingense JCM 13560 TaxID=1230454 RepID=M0PHJ5_9EURY|nr:AMP-binding protein [Halorubrum aidingense]EMA68260.1 AMP-dependent synthetase and ligase [Halorubrum aidingense JCM 13560]
MRDWLSHRVVSSPDSVALVRSEDGESWTYTGLEHLVSETAGRLVAHGIEAGDRLGVVTPPYVGTVGLIHAAMRIGATFVPLGEGLTERELAERIDSADVSAVVCAESTETAAIAAADRSEPVPVFSVDKPAVDAVAGVHDLDPDPVDPAEWGFSDTLCILFTSGTTGDPKPVPLTVGNVYSSAVASAFRLGVDPDDRWLVSLALHHMGGLAPVYRSVLYGTTLVLREGFDPGGTADDIDTYDVTGVSLVPTMLQQMLDRRGTLADSLRAVLLGGAPAPDELLERCRDYSVPVYPTYGMTESASQVATATPRQTRDRLDTVGRPLFGTDVTIVGDDGDPVDPGETGEVVVDGPTITPGYIDGETGELDRSAFGAHGLHTGDVGRVDESGFLYVLNRLDDRIISGGENVEPGEVVDVLRGFPGVEDAAVVGLDDDVWGERVSALIVVENRRQSDDSGSNEGSETGVLKAGGGALAPLDEADLVAFARERLAGFKIPKTVAYAEELPRTVSGTIDREAVRALLREEGHEPRDGTEGDLKTAGFEPADPIGSTDSTDSADTIGSVDSTEPSEPTETADGDRSEDATDRNDDSDGGEPDGDATDRDGDATDRDGDTIE